MRSAEEGLRRCLVLDPTDARGYVVLGKLLVLQKRYDEARALYQEGCSITGAHTQQQRRHGLKYQTLAILLVCDCFSVAQNCHQWDL